MDHTYTSVENKEFQNDFFDKKIKSYFRNEDYFALFYIYANFLEFNLKLVLILLHQLEEIMLHLVSKGKIDTHDSYPTGETLGQLIKKMKKYKIKKVNGVSWAKLIQELAKFKDARNDLAHSLDAHTSIKDFEKKVKDNVYRAANLVNDLQKIMNYVERLASKSMSDVKKMGKV